MEANRFEFEQACHVKILDAERSQADTVPFDWQNYADWPNGEATHLPPLNFVDSQNLSE